VKAPVDDMTAAWLAFERAALEHIAEEFVPRVLHAADDILVTEDLSHAYWPADHPGEHGPVTWLPGQIDALLETLERVAVAAPFWDVPAYEPTRYWPRIAREPHVFNVPGEWIAPLAAAEDAAAFAGNALVHNDVRSDNVCFLDDRVVLVDWSNARRGNAKIDVAQLAVTLAIEGGPDPYDVLDDGSLAAWQAGLLLTKAVDLRGQAPDWLVRVFERCSTVALTWAARCLDLAL
jgi:hypothetical protein